MIVYQSKNIEVKFQNGKLHINKSGEVPASVFVETLEKARSFALKNKVTQWKLNHNYNPYSAQRFAQTAPPIQEEEEEDLFETQQRIIARVNRLSDRFSRLRDQHDALKNAIGNQ